MYQVLYRKYRPRVFSEVVGQEHITKTLENEIKEGKLSHAYLFTGSRGTGKTTCAKIFAKAVNCLNPVNGSPCNECENCRGIDDGTILDVTEIDAASNNGVDNIRDIIAESSFAPSKGKFRVYIIDEVHMLSMGAFNALLKTLEEPPAHVKFILATTEVHKIPVTILSRCQRFDFKRVNSEAMKSRMMYIADKEGFSLTQQAASLIAGISDGGMRDALSLLDRCVSKSNNITDDLVAEVAGVAGKEHLFALADAVRTKDSGKCIALIDELYENSFSMELLCSSLIDHFRSLMIVKTVLKAENVLICTKDDLLRYKKQSELFSLQSIIRAIDLLSSCLSAIKRGVNRRIEMEMGLIRLSTPELDDSSAALLERIEKLESAIQSGILPTSDAQILPQKSNNSTVLASTEATEQTEAIPTKAEPQPQPAETENPPLSREEIVPFAKWPMVLDELKKTNAAMWGILNASTAVIKGDFVLITCQNPTLSAFIRTGGNSRSVKEAIYKITGQKYRLAVAKTTQAEAEPKTNRSSSLDSLLSKAQQLNVNVELNE